MLWQIVQDSILELILDIHLVEFKIKQKCLIKNLNEFKIKQKYSKRNGMREIH